MIHVSRSHDFTGRETCPEDPVKHQEEEGLGAEREVSWGGDGGGVDQELLNSLWVYKRRDCKRTPEVIALSLPTLLP